MSIEVNVSPRFDKDIKRLRRKYPAVSDEVNKLIDVLKHGESLPGDKVPGVG